MDIPHLSDLLAKMYFITHSECTLSTQKRSLLSLKYMLLKSAMSLETINFVDLEKKVWKANRILPSEIVRKELSIWWTLKRSVNCNSQIGFTLCSNLLFLSLMAGNTWTIFALSHRSYKVHKNSLIFLLPILLIAKHLQCF